MAQWLFRRIAFALIVSCAILGGLMYAQAHQPTAADKPVAEGSPAWFLQDCTKAWGTFPKTVVMRVHGVGDVVRTADRDLMHEAIEQAVNEAPYGHEIFQFCE